MKFNNVKLFLLNFFIPIVTAAFVNNLVAQRCVIPVPAILPCLVWNYLVVGIGVASFLDFVVYFVIPRIFKSRRDDVKIEIGEYHNLGYFQSTKVGVLINNKSDYDIFPKIKILGDIRRVEYMDDGSEKSAAFSLDKGNQIIGLTDIFVQSGNAREIIFAQVEKNENVSLLVEKPNLLKSFHSVKTGDYKVSRARWSFSFELFGKINEMKFKEGVYSISIEAGIRNGEVYLLAGELKALI